MSNNFKSNWRGVSESIEDALDEIDNLQRSRFFFGIDFLDDALCGIVSSDVILIGAPSGGGKTQLATLICKNVAKQGKRAAMLALESMKYEITMRLVYGLLQSKLNGKTYPEFLFSMESADRRELVREAVRELPGGDLLRVFYKEDTFGANELMKEFYALEDNSDLIVVDHFHFLDLSGEKSEMMEQRDLANEINRLQKQIKKPVILLAQFNKSYTKSDQLFPTLADFYGTSSLTNMVTKAITVTQRLPENYELGDTGSKRPTMLHVAKHRNDGSVTAYYSMSYFNTETNTYEPGYVLFNSRDNSPVEPHKRPNWARRCGKITPYSLYA